MESSAAQAPKPVPFISLPNDQDDDELFLFAAQLANMVPLSMSLKAAIELGVLEILSNSPSHLSAAEIAAHLPGVNNPEALAMLDQLLRLLSTFSILTSTVVAAHDDTAPPTRLYGLAKAAKYLVPNEDGVSFAPALSLNADIAFLQSWLKLKDAILGGGNPFNLAHGTTLREYLASDKEFSNSCRKSMSDNSAIVTKKIVESYEGFEDIKKLVDVGGGSGDTLRAIVSKYPNVEGVNFDLPDVIKGAVPCEGVEHVGGDMVKSVPSGDATWIKMVLHHLSDEDCVRAMENCYKALPDDGKMIVVDVVVPDECERTPLAKFNVLTEAMIMCQVEGMKVRSKNEFRCLASAAGFRRMEVAGSICGLPIMEFFK